MAGRGVGTKTQREKARCAVHERRHYYCHHHHHSHSVHRSVRHATRRPDQNKQTAINGQTVWEKERESEDVGGYRRGTTKRKKTLAGRQNATGQQVLQRRSWQLLLLIMLPRCARDHCRLVADDSEEESRRKKQIARPNECSQIDEILSLVSGHGRLMSTFFPLSVFCNRFSSVEITW